MGGDQGLPHASPVPRGSAHVQTPATWLTVRRIEPITVAGQRRIFTEFAE